jgi:uncharacterized membrane protein (DUF106 family)
MADPTGSNKTSASPGQKPADQPELCGGTTGFVMMMMMFLVLFLMINPELRTTIAVALDGVFAPIFAFDYQYPVLTLVFTSIFMVFCSTTIRHYMTDWVGIARAQKFMSAYQKEKMNAMTSGNTVKQKKLEELAPQISQYNMTLMASNLKPLAFTMIFFIIVFPWLWAVYFAELKELGYDFITLPGIDKWALNSELNICPGGFNSWILVYIVLSFPVSFLLQNGLKYISFSYKIKQTEVNQERKIKEQIRDLEDKINEMKSKGVETQAANQLLSQSHQVMEEKRYVRVSELLTEADEHLDNKLHAYERINGLIEEAELMIANADKKGIRIIESQKSLDSSKNALKRNDDTHAIYYAKQSQRQTKEARIKHKEAEETISQLKALMYDLRELKTIEADKLFEKTESAMKNKDYANVIKFSKETKQKAEEIINLNKEALDAVNSAKKALDNVKHLDLDIPGAQQLYTKATDELKYDRYETAKDFADQCRDLVKVEQDKYQNAQESVSFAKLVISNAISFGASIPEAESLLADAEQALTLKQYDRAIELANRAKDLAETAKKQQQRLAKRR